MSSALQRKVSKVLSSRVKVDSPDVIVALKGVSDLYVDGQNTATNRRNLRSVFQKQGVDINVQLIQAFHQVKEEIHRMKETVSDLNSSCRAISTSLKDAQQSTAHLLEQTKLHQEENKKLDRCTEVADKFLEKFQLSKQDIRSLEAEEINNEFFKALDRIAQIRADCKRLLKSTYHQRLGLDIMDSLAQRLERGYERLYRWVQKEGQHLTALSDVSPVLITALALLKQMPVYYDHCCSEITQARRLLLIQRFVQALAQGGPDGVPRPIEMHAHDPVRFVSDMYAWIHQNVAEERDFFMNLLDTVSDAEGKQMKLVPGRNNQEYSMDNNDIDNDNFNSNFMGDKVNSSLHDKYGNDKNASNDDNGNTGDYTAGVGTQRDNETIHVQVDQSDKLLAQVMEGVSRPLKLRVEQALQTQPTPLITFKLLNVTTFYRDTIRALLSPGAELSACLEELVELAGHTFFHLVEKVNNKMLTSPPQYTLDLSPPKVVTEQINRLDMLMRAYKKSLISSTQKDRDFAPVLSAILDPLSQVISASAASADLEPSDHAVYHINTITAAQNVLRKYPFARSRLEILTLTLDTYVEQLVNSQCTVLFREVGLADKMTAIARIADLKARGITEYVDSDNNGNNCDSLGNSLSRNSDDDQSFNNQNAAADKKTPKSMRLCDVPELQIDLLAQALSNFYTNLFSVGTFVMPQCDRILNAQVRRATRKAFAVLVSQGYRSLYQAVLDPPAGYDRATLARVLVHTPQQVDTLLEIATPFATPNHSPVSVNSVGSF